MTSAIEAEHVIWSRRLRRKNCAYSRPSRDDPTTTSTASVLKSSGRQPVSAAQNMSTTSFALLDSLPMSSKGGFTTQDFSPCILRESSAASPRLQAKVVWRRFENKAGRRRANEPRRAPESPTSSPLRRDVPGQWLRPARPTPCARLEPNPRRADNAEPVHPIRFVPNACDDPTGRGGTRPETSPGKWPGWRSCRAREDDIGSPNRCRFWFGRTPDRVRRRGDNRSDSNRRVFPCPTTARGRNGARPT